VFHIVEGNVVTPRVYGRAVNIHPAVILLGIPAGSAIAGVLGMFLVVPFIGIVSKTWRIVLHVFGPIDPAAGGTSGDASMPVAGPAGEVDIIGPEPVPG
jgi:predicted PurR-regulated permease PerM